MFSEQEEYIEHAVHVGTYTCPWCGQAVQFRTQHFRKHEKRNPSNLRQEWQTVFNAFRPVSPKGWESFLDFHCPQCDAPVRIIYDAGGEWAMGVHSWVVKEIVETNYPQMAQKDTDFG